MDKESSGQREFNVGDKVLVMRHWRLQRATVRAVIREGDRIKLQLDFGREGALIEASQVLESR